MSPPVRWWHGRTRAIAVLRATRADAVDAVCEVLIAGGISIIEVTTTLPGYAAVISRLREAHPGAAVGAGTVTAAEQLREVAAAGAQFVVSPISSSELGAAASQEAVAYVPGALTPTEVVGALAHGACAVKIFPAASMAAGHIRELRGPFPDVAFVPTGGITIEGARAYRDAGAALVGLGSALTGDALDGGSLDELAVRARRLCDVVGDGGR